MDQELPFGRLVRERRRALDLTQEELANRVGCAAITLRKIEAGVTRPSQQIAERLAVALAIPPDERGSFVRRARGVRVDSAADDAPQTPPLPTPVLEVGAEDLSGRAIRNYLLGERLGIGSFGAVYRAVQPLIERPVAVKIILPQYADHPDFVRRFEHEARIVARLEHPHIVPLYDYWREPGVAYLVMRLLSGSLQARLGQEPFELAQVLRLAEQLVAALAAAHRAGIVHRDLKPANILLDAEANAYLADFGIAKDLARGHEDGTLAGAFVGSPAYSSPEQIRAEPITPQTDIYALGVLLFELLTGQRPFPGSSHAELIQQHLTGSIPPLANLRAGLPPALDTLIQRATAKVPSARYPDVQTLLVELRAALGGASAPPAVAPTPAIAAPATVELELTDADTPFVGLRAFGEGDAASFFGREALLQQLLARLGESGELSRFLAVVGPSGSGKSSVVRAGLIPALRAGALPASEQWFIVDLLPGADPYAALASALWRLAPAGVEADDLRALLQADVRGLVRAARLVLPTDQATELVLVIDQFEELFTLTEDEGVRVAVLDRIVTAVLDERSRLRVVLTLRADFLDRPLRYVDFGELVKRRSELVLPLTPDELERAIIGPAARSGVGLEQGLAAALISEVEGRPGALPLLQHALSELFLRRSGRVLTRAAYGEIGGVAGALAGSAESCYAELDEQQQELVRQLFLRLITIGEGVEDTRRRVQRSELHGLGEEALLGAALASFGRARLLSFDRDAASHAPTVEVTHEALLRAWPRLQGWIEGGREEVLVQRRLAVAAAEWAAAGYDTSYLATGGRLAQFTALAAGGSVRLTTGEHVFVEASQAANAAAAATERERQARELLQAQALAEEQRQRAEASEQAASAQRTAAQRLRYLVGALAVFLAVALSLSAFAFQQRGAAETNFTRAEAQRLAAEANRIIALQGNSEAAALLALRSIKLGYTPQGDEALGKATGLEFASRILTGNTFNMYAAIWAPDGRGIYTTGSDLILRYWDAASGQEQRSIVLPNEGGDIAITSAGDTLAIGRSDGTVELRDPASFELIAELDALSGEVRKLSFTGDGQRLLVSGSDTVAQLWAVASRQLLQQFRHPAIVPAAILAPDRRTVVTGDSVGVIRVWDLSTGTQLREWQAHKGSIEALAIGAGEGTLLSASYDSSVFLWDLASGEWRFTLPHRDSVLGADCSPDGRWCATVGTDLTVHLWDTATGEEVRRFTGHNGNLFTVRFSPDSRLIVTASFDGTARIYAVQPQGPPQFIGHPQGVNSATLSADGTTVLTGDRTGMLRFWDTATGEPIWAVQAHATEVTEIAFLHSIGSAVTTSGDGTLRVWNLARGTEVRTIARGEGLVSSGGLGISPDGQRVFASSDMGAQLWDLGSGQSLRAFDDFPFTAVFLPDGATVISLNFASGPDGGQVSIWDTTSGALVHRFLPNPGRTVFGLAITPDGEHFATGSDDGVIQLWEYGSWREVGRFVGHSDIPWKLVFSPDGSGLLSAGLDRTARLWDVASYEELRRFVHPQRLYNSVAFTPDGKRVLTASTDGTARLWDVELADAVADLCARLQRDFTPEERAQYGIPDDGPTCPGQAGR